MKTLINTLFLNHPSYQHHVWYQNIQTAKAFLNALILLIVPMVSMAQEAPKALQESNLEIRTLTERVDPNGWLFFSGETRLEEGDLFSKYTEAMGLGRDDKMVVTSDITDELGLTHVKYKQEYKGIPVDGGEYIVHIKGCEEYLASGEIVENLQLEPNPRISKSQALILALEATNSRSFAWENEEWETELKEEEENSKATYLPEPTMVITAPLASERGERIYNLAYRYLIQLVNPNQVLQVDINALDGQTINVINTTIECFKSHKHSSTCSHNHDSNKMDVENSNGNYATGTATTSYYGNRQIQTQKRGFPRNDYILNDKTRGKGITTKDNCCSGNIKDKDNIWLPNQSKFTQAHWTIGRSWDYFKNVHGRNGTDGNGRKLKVKANLDNSNAYYSENLFGQTITVGHFTGNPLSTMDIMAHEYTHGITRATAGLKYQGESGALNESFSDIFGTMAESYSGAGSFDWTMGEDASWTIRNLSNPQQFNQPDTYKGQDWVSTSSSSDHGGVHTNSGVQNKWFVLLADGGTHNGINVQGIGKTKAAKIAYRNLSVYLNSGSNYMSARIGAINSAKDLYGPCSAELIATTNAWAAVKVGNPFEGNCVKIIGVTNICIDLNMLPRTFTAQGLTGSTFTWSQIPSNWTYTIGGQGNNKLTLKSVNTNGVNLPKTYNIKVTSNQGGSDNHFVTIRKCFIDPPCGDIE